MAITVSVSTQNFANFLKRADVSLGDKKQFLRDIADSELSDTRQRFVLQIAPDGTPWKRTQRQKKDFSAKILRKTGNLFNSLASKIIGNSVYIGTNVKYGIFHQEGTNSIPKRQFIGANQKTILNIDKAIRNLIEKGIK